MNPLRGVLRLAAVAASIAAAPGFAASATPGAAPTVLPFVHDFEAALDKARTERRPVFVEAWAPW